MNLKINKKSISLENFKRINKVLAKNSFKVILLFFLLSLIFGYFIYYKYFFLATNKEPVLTKDFVDIKEENFQKVLEEWEHREKKFQEANFKDYPNFMKTELLLTEEEN